MMASCLPGAMPLSGSDSRARKLGGRRAPPPRTPAVYGAAAEAPGSALRPETRAPLPCGSFFVPEAFHDKLKTNKQTKYPINNAQSAHILQVPSCINCKSRAERSNAINRASRDGREKMATSTFPCDLSITEEPKDNSPCVRTEQGGLSLLGLALSCVAAASRKQLGARHRHAPERDISEPSEGAPRQTPPGAGRWPALASGRGLRLPFLLPLSVVTLDLPTAPAQVPLSSRSLGAGGPHPVTPPAPAEATPGARGAGQGPCGRHTLLLAHTAPPPHLPAETP